jgi:4-carboxymuconolactone decarboxylase
MKNAKPESAAQKAIGNLAPKLVELTEEVLFGDVWRSTPAGPTRCRP